MTEFEKGFEEGYTVGYQQALRDVRNPTIPTVIHDPGDIVISYEEAYGAAVVRHLNKKKE